MSGQVYASEALSRASSALPTNVLEAALDSWAQLGVQHAIPVTGQSMWPTLRDGDRVWIAHGLKRVRLGDVIVYRRKGRLIVHRVVLMHAAPTNRHLFTRGDNSQHTDARVERSQVIGQVIAVEHNGYTRPMPTGKWLWLQWGVAWCVARLWHLGRKLR